MSRVPGPLVNRLLSFQIRISFKAYNLCDIRKVGKIKQLGVAIHFDLTVSTDRHVKLYGAPKISLLNDLIILFLRVTVAFLHLRKDIIISFIPMFFAESSTREHNIESATKIC